MCTPDGADAERKHLETLLANRINFFIVIVTIFLVGSFEIKDATQRALFLTVGFTTSCLITLAILRTNHLVQQALDHLPDGHCYQVFRRRVPAYLPHANYLMVAIPVLLTLFIGGLLLHQLDRL